MEIDGNNKFIPQQLEIVPKSIFSHGRWMLWWGWIKSPIGLNWIQDLQPEVGIKQLIWGHDFWSFPQMTVTGLSNDLSVPRKRRAELAVYNQKFVFKAHWLNIRLVQATTMGIRSVSQNWKQHAVASRLHPALPLVASLLGSPAHACLAITQWRYEYGIRLTVIFAQPNPKQSYRNVSKF